jgi:hypothetical protein
MKNEMTNEQVKRIAIARMDTERMLAKELTYSLHLQKPATVAFYRAHLVKLDAMADGIVRLEVFTA